MILCAGPQSSGSTLLSWCFLQRADTTGVLDMENDVLRVTFDPAPVIWCKMTIGGFRWIDVADLYRDFGLDPAPLLIVRDVRDVLASLVTKEYGFNGVTAEEPPLRMRLRRFLADWELFRSRGWPIIRFESLVDDPRKTLGLACDELGLGWDEGMVNWPKPHGAVIPPNRPGFNHTFLNTVTEPSMEAAVAVWRRRAPRPLALPEEELDWLERVFEEYNRMHDYPPRVDRGAVTPGALPRPRMRSARARGWPV
jgi:hypothetical protein